MFLSRIMGDVLKLLETHFLNFRVLPPVTLLSVTFFPQDEKIDRFHHWKADKIIFPTVLDTFYNNFF